MKIIFFFIFFFTMFHYSVMAGNITAPSAPTDPASAMYTLEDLYNRINSGASGVKRTGAFTEPPGTPAPTGHTLDDIMSKLPLPDNSFGAKAADVRCKKLFWGLRTDGTWGQKEGTLPCLSPVSKTGQNTSFTAGDDGHLKKGVAWPSNRFTDNSNGTITDNLTNLVWMKNANCWGLKTWSDAHYYVINLNSGTQSCSGYTAGTHTDWRLPTIRELRSLIDFSKYSPQLSSNHPFVGVQTTKQYWSSTIDTNTSNTSRWFMSFDKLLADTGPTTQLYYVWAVRGQETSETVGPVQVTGVTRTTYGRSGVTWPTPRFTDNGDGTIFDELTGLIWLKGPNCLGATTWPNAFVKLTELNSGAEFGCTEYIKGAYEDWRLPNINELESLISYASVYPALPSDHPFMGNLNDYFWTSTTTASQTTYAWILSMGSGYASPGYGKTRTDMPFRIWPVRGGS